ncbi:MAG TPA: cytochrome c [Ferruginibacter sp.]|nr:cytochrome c [Ferruginibacter sp.]
MIPIPIKRPVILFSIALISLYGLSGCSDQKTESTSTTTDSTSLAVQTTATSDSLAIIQNGDSAAPIETAVNNNEMNAADKTEEKETVKKTTDVKTVVTTTTTTIPGVKTVAKPVVATAAPAKPAAVAQPAPTATVTPKATPTPAPAPVIAPKPAAVVVATTKADDGGWAVPANYKTMKSPYPNDKESIALGKSIYGTHCKSCHGSKGEGNGPKANTIDTKMRSFLIPAFRSQSQGEIFYKSMVGRKDMPRFEKKIPDKEEQWAVVHYIMSL